MTRITDQHRGPGGTDDGLLAALHQFAEPDRVGVDPLPGVRHRVSRRRRRRQLTIGLVTTTAVIGAIAGVSLLGPGLSGTHGTELTPSGRNDANSSKARLDGPNRTKVSDQRAEGAGFEEYVEGDQGPGYLVNGVPEAQAVSHRLDGSGPPCLTAEPDATFHNARFCFDGWGGERVRWHSYPGPDGSVYIMGFAKLDVGTVEFVDVNGDAGTSMSVVSTPTSDQVGFFELWLNKTAPEIVDVRPEGADAGKTVTESSGRHGPEPWTNRKFTEKPEANAYTPVGYVIAKGKVEGTRWAIIGDIGEGAGCLSEEPGAIFESMWCVWASDSGERAVWNVVAGSTGSKPDYEPVDATLVQGAVSMDARHVEIETVDGKRYTTDAVGTPLRNNLRFFATVVPIADAKVAEVRPLDANGELAEPLGELRNNPRCHREGMAIVCEPAD